MAGDVEILIAKVTLFPLFSLGERLGPKSISHGYRVSFENEVNRKSSSYPFYARVLINVSVSMICCAP